MFKNLIYSSFGILASVAGTIVVFIIAARSLGPAAFGDFAITYASCSIAGIAFDFGYITRFLNESRRNTNGHAVIGTVSLANKFILFFCLSLTLAIAFAWIGVDFWLGAIIWLGIALISTANIFASILRGIGVHRLDAFNYFVANFGGVMLALVVWWLNGGRFGFAFVFVTLGAVYLFLTLWLWRSNGTIRRDRITLSTIFAEIRCNLPYALDALVQRSFGFFDVIILAIVAAPVEVGIYQAAQKIAQGANIFAQPFNNVVLPRLSRAAVDKSSFFATARKWIGVQVAVGVTALIGISLVGPSLVDWLYTPDYSPARSLMPLFGLLVAIRFLTSALAISVTALGLQRQRFYIGCAGLGVMILATFVLGSLYAATGVILGLIVASATMALLCAVVLV